MNIAPVLLVFAALLLAACAAPTTATDTPVLPQNYRRATAARTLTPDPRTPTVVSASDPRALGNPAAPITLIEFTDYQCSYCAVFATEIKPQIIAEYVNTGRVYLVTRDFPLPNHSAAPQAAAAAQCAAQQQAFQPMHDRLFSEARNGAWGDGGAGDQQIFSTYAAEIGLDSARFTACLTNPATFAQVEADLDVGRQLGLNSTPTFLINGERISGAQPYVFWKHVFDELLTQR